jgi:hypothetical protein
MATLVKLISPHGAVLWEAPVVNVPEQDIMSEVSEGDASISLRRTALQAGVSEAGTIVGRLIVVAA